MRTTIGPALLILMLVVACAEVQEVVYTEEHGGRDFSVVFDGHEHLLTYEATHDITGAVDPDVRLVVFVHHGGSQTPVRYFKSATAALVEAAVERPEHDFERTTMIVAPAMIGEHHIADNPDRYAAGHYPYWTGSWREGAWSVNLPRVSNYDLLDSMVLHVADNFPGVKAIVHLGFSAGGQLVSRYALGTTAYDALHERRIFTRYIISNPSSLLYFDQRRPDLEAEEGFIDYSDRIPVVDGEECGEFNDYRYGFGGELVEYMSRRPVAQMIADFRGREVFLLKGLADNDPEHSGLDRRCGGMLQGRHRLERGVRYYEYLGEFYGPEIYRNKFITFVPDVGHSPEETFVSSPAREILFFDADSARDAVFGRDPGR